ncbi:HD domain-containing protein [Roseovarius indicus]|uniref:HD domain-containing protein n=1 Tax=Roseovarius indicus TaxID=540747 RepID=UPI0007DA335D|nr:HD domain-containing protein [Roseovarius indicus]OAO02665.1 hydrolase [Roseovarius indicus]
MSDAPLDDQIAFLNEACRLKSVTRTTTLCDGSRYENSAEHSWHLALYAMVLEDHAPEGTDISRVIRMLLLHDIVEIDAGDTPIYGTTGHDDQAEREAEAARRLFGLLPEGQGDSFRALWEEFEAAVTPDARFAKALDRFQPPNQNLASDGIGWRENGATWDKFEARIAPSLRDTVPAFWAYIAPKVKAWFSRNG